METLQYTYFLLLTELLSSLAWVRFLWYFSWHPSSMFIMCAWGFCKENGVYDQSEFLQTCRYIQWNLNKNKKHNGTECEILTCKAWSTRLELFVSIAWLILARAVRTVTPPSISSCSKRPWKYMYILHKSLCILLCLHVLERCFLNKSRVSQREINKGSLILETTC